MAHAHDECVEPEEHEELIHHYVAGVVVPLNLREELIGFLASNRLTDRKNEDKGHEPDGEPEEGKDVSDEGKQEDTQVTANVLSSRLVDSDTNANSIPAAANTAHVEASDAPERVRSVLNVVMVFIVGLVSICLHIDVGTGSNQ